MTDAMKLARVIERTIAPFAGMTPEMIAVRFDQPTANLVYNLRCTLLEWWAEDDAGDSEGGSADPQAEGADRQKQA